MSLYADLYEDLEQTPDTLWGLEGFVDSFIQKHVPRIGFDEALELLDDFYKADRDNRKSRVIKIIAIKSLRKCEDKK